MPKKIKNANTNGFDKNPQNINRTGLNRKTVGSVIKQLKEKGIEQVSSKQVIELFESLLNCTEDDLKKIVDDKKEPMLNRIVAKELLDKKGFDVIEKILDRVHGKAKQVTDIEMTSKNTFNIEVLDDETKQEIEKLNKYDTPF